jgi:hypothetical protein
MRREVAFLVGIVVGLAAPDLLRGSPEPVREAVASFPPVPAGLDMGTAPLPPLVSGGSVRRARRWAARRQGEVAFAVLDDRRRLRGLAQDVPMASASLSKAMLLLAVLRRARELDVPTRSTLRAMVTASDNDAADAIYARVGSAGLTDVARAARMTGFGADYWSEAQVTAADQVRLFVRLDRVVPSRHRRLARSLLSSIVPWQSWGIARVARRHHLRVWFKGGWRTDVVHQAALVEGRGRRAAIAVLTRGSPSFEYAVATLEGVAARLLR